MKYDVGFLGGGQLARMSIMAAQRMGLKCLSLDPGSDTPASQVAPAIQGSLGDPEKVAEVLGQCWQVTLENEFIPANTISTAVEIAKVDEGVLVPGIGSLATIQDKLLQRQAYERAGVPSPFATAIEGDGEKAVESLGFPMVLKARFGGYDGKGTRYAHSQEEFDSFRDLWGPGGWMAEEYVPFRRELAVMVYISPDQVGAFPTMETIQTNHVCDLVFPCDADGTEVAIAAAEAMGGSGLFGIELFECQDGQILVNEIAPRPHNTGHYSLDWGGVSQFEQHVRLVCGLPLSLPEGLPTCMANLLGQEAAGDYRGAMAAAMDDPTVHFHWYGKAESRPGRKMGHINAVGATDVRTLRAKALQARALFYEAWTGRS